MPKIKTKIVFVLDQSGSMWQYRTDVVGSFNVYFDNVKRDLADQDISVTFVTFDTERKFVLSDVPISDVPILTEKDYIPNGATALNDAVGFTIAEVTKNLKKSHRVLFVILTDGEENSSKEFDHTKVVDLIKQKTDGGNWTFVYLADNIDAWDVGKNYGFSHGNTESIKMSDLVNQMQTVYTRTRAYAQSSRMSVSNFTTLDESDQL